MSQPMSTEALLGLVVFASFAVAYGIELVSGRVFRTKRPLRDALFVLTGMLAQSTLSGLVLATALGLFLAYLLPENAGGLADVPFWIAFPLLWVTIEGMHYWLHRFSHENKWLWNLHRTHHSAMDLNVGVVFRYNVFWTVLLPQA